MVFLTACSQSGIVREYEWPNEMCIGPHYCIETEEGKCEPVIFSEVGDLAWAVDKPVIYSGEKIPLEMTSKTCPMFFKLTKIELDE